MLQSRDKVFGLTKGKKVRDAPGDPVLQSARYIQEFLGHSDLKTTRGYL
jgi:integrase